MDSATTNNELEILGSNLLLLRQQYGFSQKHMAIILGIGVKKLTAIGAGLPSSAAGDRLSVSDTGYLSYQTPHIADFPFAAKED